MHTQVTRYSKIGEFHKQKHLENQDFIYEKETECAVFYAVADGVSACANSSEGARIACEISAKVILDDVDYYFDLKREKAIHLVISNIRKAIEKAAASAGAAPLSFASTLCFLCIHKKAGRIMTFVLGDSRIYGIRSGTIIQKNPVREYRENVTCTTMTAFAQADAAFAVNCLDKNEAWMLCTDGCWKELFFLDDNKQISMREMRLDRIAGYLERRTIGDDCTFLTVA